MDKKKFVGLWTVFVAALLMPFLNRVFPPAHDGISGVIRTAEQIAVTLLIVSLGAMFLNRKFKEKE